MKSVFTNVRLQTSGAHFQVLTTLTTTCRVENFTPMSSFTTQRGLRFVTSLVFINKPVFARSWFIAIASSNLFVSLAACSQSFLTCKSVDDSVRLCSDRYVRSLFWWLGCSLQVNYCCFVHAIKAFLKVSFEMVCIFYSL